MNSFWAWLLGIDRQRIPAGAETKFEWTHAPKSWEVFVLLAVVGALIYAVFFLYRRENEVCPPRWRLILAGLRTAVIVILALVFMGPALAISQRRSVEPYILLLFDDSFSMSIRDRYPDPKAAARIARAAGYGKDELRKKLPSRAELLTAILRRDDGRVLRQFAAKGKVRIMTFSDRVKLREVLGAAESSGEAAGLAADEKIRLERGRPVPPLVPASQSTNIARGLRESLRAVSGSTVAAIILVSDGMNTAGEDPLSAADAARRQAAPIFTVGIGDPSEPRNIKVAEIIAPDNVFRQDPFVVEAVITAKGYPQTNITVELVERRLSESGAAATGTGTVVARETVRLEKGENRRRVLLKHQAEAAGKFVYAVRVAPLADELLDSDNEKSASVNVLDEQARVLLIAGAPSWDYRLVKSLLIRDKTMNVSCWLQSMSPDMRQDGNTIIEKLPSQPRELFKYDVLLMFDPNPIEFNEAWIDAIRRFLDEHAGGLLWLSGYTYSGRFLSLPRTQSIRDLLPVRFGEIQARGHVALGGVEIREWPLRLKAAGVDHPILRLDRDPLVNQRLWAAMPGVYWSFPVAAAKPAAQVLIEHGNPRFLAQGASRPLLVVGHYGAGSTLYLGLSGTWRWRKLGQRYFDRFWVQTIRYLMGGRLTQGQRRGRLLTDRNVYQVGDRIGITTTLYDQDFRPLEQAAVEALVASSKGAPEKVKLMPAPGRPGTYEGFAIARHLGINEVSVTLPEAAGPQPLKIARRITVEVPNIEFADPRMNKKLLIDISQRSGGKYFDIDQWAEIPRAIPDRRETIRVQGRPVELWDTSRLLLLLALLLTVEWALRKRYSLL